MRNAAPVTHIAASIICVLFSTPAFAASSYSTHHNRGAAVFDHFSCGEFVADFKHQHGTREPRYQIEMAYVEGFLTAANISSWQRNGPQIATTSDRPSRGLYLYDYCAVHPLEPFVNALDALVHRYWHEWPAVRR